MKQAWGLPWGVPWGVQQVLAWGWQLVSSKQVVQLAWQQESNTQVKERGSA